MRDIILGRSAHDTDTLGTRGTVFIGKQYVQMGQTSSLSNSIHLDVARAHAMLIVGKRGGGKSYTMGSIAEGLADMDPEVSKNLSFVMLDTMGVYWSMKYGNKKEDELLKKWGLEGKGLNVIICVPGGFFEKYQQDGIECDYPLYIRPNELSLEDWRLSFNLKIDDPIFILLAKYVGAFLKSKENFDVDDLISSIQGEKELSRETVLSTIIRLEGAKSWGIFSKNARPIRDLLFPGKVTVLDFSAYVSMPGGWEVKALALGLIAKKIFVERMLVRKQEEISAITSKTQISGERKFEGDLPMPWLIVDEAHEFLPESGETPATNALMTILREGRQPGVSLILATQQPAKIHTDAITQSDIVIAHRLTASFDLQSLDKIFLSYNSKGSKALFNQMPKTKGCAIIMDDKNERLYTMQVKPRITWHGGEDPSAIEEIEEEFDF
ncbi:MAG: ATP-binding protein [Candidatus Nanoarchaeia archaeon]